MRTSVEIEGEDVKVSAKDYRTVRPFVSVWSDEESVSIVTPSAAVSYKLAEAFSTLAKIQEEKERVSA